MSNDDRDLRSSLLDDLSFSGEDVSVSASQVADGRIFGLTAVERMILSIVLFLAVTVLGIALLFITGTIALH